MTDRLPAIKRRKVRDGWITQNQADWLIQEVERLRKECAAWKDSYEAAVAPEPFGIS